MRGPQHCSSLAPSAGVLGLLLVTGIAKGVALLLFGPNLSSDQGGFQVTPPRILMLLPQPNSSLFVVLREANRKCEPKFNL